MKVHYLQNHTSSSTKEEEFFKLISRGAFPKTVKTKRDYESWITNPNTNYYFYSAAEGVNKHLSISKNNPAWKLHGFVADYDTKGLTLDQIKNGIEKNCPPDMRPAYYSVSFSGGAHVVWSFEKPINILNPKALEVFTKHFVSAAKVKRIAPGYDAQPAHKYYTLNPNWKSTGESVADPILQHLLYQVSISTNKYVEGEVDLPWDFIEEQMNQKFPGRWKSRYEQHARGVRFWDPTATDPTSATLTTKGVHFFTDGGGFLPWRASELFGPSVVRKYESGRVGSAIKDIYYDGNKYYRLHEDKWYVDNKADVGTVLKCAGLSAKSLGDASEIDLAFTHILNNNRVEGTMPTIYNSNKIVYRKGLPFINTNRCYALDPAEGNMKWAENFPFIAEWLDNFFVDQTQLTAFLCWLSHAYRNAYLQTPKKGHTLFVVGPANKGKSLLANKLIGWLLGGATDISKFLMGKEDFNDNLFPNGVGTVDDEEAATDAKSHLTFSAIVKKMTANYDHSMRKMYSGRVDVTWPGRIVVTLNRDAYSMRMLPNLDISIRDKLMILQASSKPIDFPPDVEDVIREELSYFANFLLNYQIPKEWKGNSRFGVKEYIDPLLMEETQFQSYENTIQELLDDWREQYFLEKKSEPYWFGNTTQLLKELVQAFDGEYKLLEGCSAVTLGRKVSMMTSRGCKWVELSAKGGKRGYKIWNPDQKK